MNLLENLWVNEKNFKEDFFKILGMEFKFRSKDYSIKEYLEHLANIDKKQIEEIATNKNIQTFKKNLKKEYKKIKQEQEKKDNKYKTTVLVWKKEPLLFPQKKERDQFGIPLWRIQDYMNAEKKVIDNLILMHPIRWDNIFAMEMKEIKEIKEETINKAIRYKKSWGIVETNSIKKFKELEII